MIGEEFAVLTANEPKHKPGATGSRFVFVVNNYTDDHVATCVSFVEDPSVRYVCVAKEVGAQGTPHLQGYLQFHPNVRNKFGWFHSRFGTNDRSKNVCWVTLARGTAKQASEYVTKGLHKVNGKAVVKDGFDAANVILEHGECPPDKGAQAEGEKRKWEEVWQLARSGNFESLVERHPRIALQYRNGLLAECKRARVDTGYDPTLLCEFFWGPTRTGKTRTARENLGRGLYVKSANSKWWPNYADQEKVLMEELGPENVKEMGNLLKVWTDAYPFTAEMKSGDTGVIRPKHIIITSNHSLDELFGHDVEGLLKPLKSRLKVTHFSSLNVPLYPQDAEHVLEDEVIDLTSTVAELLPLTQ